jgi:hypothetical protein
MKIYEAIWFSLLDCSFIIVGVLLFLLFLLLLLNTSFEKCENVGNFKNCLSSGDLLG